MKITRFSVSNGAFLPAEVSHEDNVAKRPNFLNNIMLKLMTVGFVITLGFAGFAYTAIAQVDPVLPHFPHTAYTLQEVLVSPMGGELEGKVTVIDHTNLTPPDFPNNPFIKGRPCPPLDLGEGCLVEFEYHYRTAGGFYRDLFITQVSYKGNCPMLQYMTADTYKWLIDRIMQHIIGNCNPWNEVIPECNQMTQPIWRLGRPSCITDWHWIYCPIRDVFYWGFRTCELNTNAKFCWNVVRFCFEVVNGVRIMRRHEISSGTNAWMCPPTFNGFPQIKCHPKCD